MACGFSCLPHSILTRSMMFQDRRCLAPRVTWRLSDRKMAGAVSASSPFCVSGRQIIMQDFASEGSSLYDYSLTWMVWHPAPRSDIRVLTISDSDDILIDFRRLAE